ncbi:MAG: peptidoglycan-binding protein [Gaiellaceae bacterium MAG52_C11]|nr:peptidoglycan-binding protein [Candidatus Gaiellasilicea maunaloa]
MSPQATTTASPAQGDSGTAAVEGGRRRRVLVAAVAGVCAVTAAVVVAVVVSGDDEASGQRTAATATATAGVVRRDLIQRDTIQGTLTYTDGRNVPNYRQGTVTLLPAEGATLARGDVLYRVDTKPVVLFDGAHPAWRALAEGVAGGDDVRQLEVNLRALGYDEGGDMTIDNVFGSTTRAAVERWQEDHAVDATGVVMLGDVVFLPGKRRVGTLRAAVGDRVRGGQSLMATTATSRVVNADIEASRQGDVNVGDGVIVDLLNGTTAKGTIAEVGQVAKTATANGNTTSTIALDVRLEQPGIAGRLDQAPVEVDITNERANDVLAVPVTALLGLRGGGYGVEVMRGGVPTVIEVEPGIYSDGGYVEIESGALEEGDKVVVPV